MVMAKMDRIVLVIVVFMLIYNPPIWHYKSLLVLFAISAVYIVINFNNIQRMFRKVILGYCAWLLMFIYIALVAFLNNNPASYLKSFIYILAAVIPTSVMITSIIKKKGLDFHYLLDTILYAGLFQCGLAISAFFIRRIKNVLVALMISGGVFKDDTYSAYMQNLRLFGFSTGLTYGMPAVQAFLAIIALYLAINKKGKAIKYFLMVPLFAFSGIINARTSIVIMGIGMIALAVSFSNKNTASAKIKALRIVGIAIIGIISIIFGLWLIKTLSPNTYIWIDEGISQISRFFNRDTSSGYFSYVTDKDQWSIPSGLDLFLGTGIRVLDPNKYGVSTDIGYVNDLYFGGILYSLLLYVLIAKYHLQIRLSKCISSPGLSRFLSLFFLASFIVLNYKGYVFDLNNFFVLFVLIVVFCVSSSSENAELFVAQDKLGDSNEDINNYSDV